MSEKLSNYLKDNKVICATNYMHDQLSMASRSFYSDSFEQIYSAKGTDGVFGYKFIKKMLTDLGDNVDYVVYFEEDCFLIDLEALYETLKIFIEGNYILCGMPDGGCVSHRIGNKMMINPFFSIWNMKHIRNFLKEVSWEEIEKTYVEPYAYRYRNKCPFAYDISSKMHSDRRYHRHKSVREKMVESEGHVPYAVDQDHIGEYYKLFFRMYDYMDYSLDIEEPFMYLPARDAEEVDNDGCATILYAAPYEQYPRPVKELCVHSWYARLFENPYHERRIRKCLEYCQLKRTGLK